MPDVLKAPDRNGLLGSLADLAQASYSPERTQQMQGLMKFLGMPDVAATLDRLSYGEPLTTGTGWTTRMKPETEGAVMAATGMIPSLKGVEAGTAAVGKAIEPAVAKWGTNVLNQGGIGSQLLQDLAQGSQSKIFIGAESALWDKNRAFQASKMLSKGVSPEEVWQKTGTFKSPDGLLRQEIDDSGSKFINLHGISQKADALRERNQQIKDILAQSKVQPDLFPKELKGAQKMLRDEAKSNRALLSDVHGVTAQQHRGNYAPLALEHNALYEAYPELKDVIIRQGESDRGGLLGSYLDKDLKITAQGLAQDPRSTAIHEMQHAVQDIEGFGRGGSSTFAFNDPETAKIYERLKKEANTPISFEKYKKQYGTYADRYPEKVQEDYQEYLRNIANGSFVKSFDRAIQEQAAQEYYKRLAGEAEARAVQKRLNMTPQQRRETFPLSNYDINPNDAIVRNRGVFYD